MVQLGVQNNFRCYWRLFWFGNPVTLGAVVVHLVVIKVVMFPEIRIAVAYSTTWRGERAQRSEDVTLLHGIEAWCHRPAAPAPPRAVRDSGLASLQWVISGNARISRSRFVEQAVDLSSMTSSQAILRWQARPYLPYPYNFSSLNDAPQ